MKAFDDGGGPMLWVGGDIGVGGPFPSDNVARWNGIAWIQTDPLNERVTSFGVFDDGTGPAIYAGGFFDLGTFQRGIARWNGTYWMPLGGSGLFGGQSVWANAMATFDAGNGPELYIGGAFHGGGATISDAIVRWTGSTWLPLGSGLAPVSGSYVEVNALQVFDDGTGAALYVAGHFGSADGVLVNNIARWDGTQWSSVGVGADDPGGGVSTLAVFDDGNGPALYAQGSFITAGSYIVRWDGTRWVGLPNPLELETTALLAFDDGTGPGLYAAGYHFPPLTAAAIAKWDGHVWRTLGDGLDSHAFALAEFDEHLGHGPELFVGGMFSVAGGGIPSHSIAKWTSCSHPIESMCVGDNTLASCPCANVGLPGHGCNNSITSGGALLAATGSTAPDTLVLTSSGELPTALSIVLQGTDRTEVVTAFGDGLRCVGGTLLRLYVENAQGGTVAAPAPGGPSITARSAQLGDPIPPGSVRYYQVYYRDPNQSFCPGPRGGTFNVSNGMRVVW